MNVDIQGRFTATKSAGGLGFSTNAKIITDTVTGVQYLFVGSGYGGGLCAMLDSDGKPLLADNAKSRL